MACTLVIPIRSFNNAMTRLSDEMDEQERSELMELCVSRVIQAAKNTSDIERISLLSKDKQLKSYSDTNNVELFISDSDLNEAITEFRCKDENDYLIVALGDLFYIDDFSKIRNSLNFFDVVIGCDRHTSGTNVLGIRKGLNFNFNFGIDSYEKHCRELVKNGYCFETIKSYRYMFDIDDINDLNIVKKMGPVS